MNLTLGKAASIMICLLIVSCTKAPMLPEPPSPPKKFEVHAERSNNILLVSIDSDWPDDLPITVFISRKFMAHEIATSETATHEDGYFYAESELLGNWRLPRSIKIDAAEFIAEVEKERANGFRSDDPFDVLSADNQLVIQASGFPKNPDGSNQLRPDGSH